MNLILTWLTMICVKAGVGGCCCCHCSCCCGCSAMIGWRCTGCCGCCGASGGPLVVKALAPSWSWWSEAASPVSVSRPETTKLCCSDEVCRRSWTGKLSFLIFTPFGRRSVVNPAQFESTETCPVWKKKKSTNAKQPKQRENKNLAELKGISWIKQIPINLHGVGLKKGHKKWLVSGRPAKRV